jgi:predicted esterase
MFNNPVIPRCDDLVLNGAPEAWANRGLLFNVLQNDNDQLQEYKDKFAARARLAWSGDNLLARIEVDVDQSHESAHDNILWTADHCRIGLGTCDGLTRTCQIIVAPGLDPEHPQMRTQIQEIPILDQVHVPYTYDVASYPFPAKVTVTKTPTGYAAEFSIPWSSFGITPADGQTVGLLLSASHLEQGKWMRTLALYPYGRGLAFQEKAYFTLGGTPSLPIDTMARTTVLSPQLLRVFYSVSPQSKGHIIVTENNGKEIDRLEITDPATPYYAHLVLLPSNTGTINIQVHDGPQLISELTQDDYDNALKKIYRDIPFQMTTIFGLPDPKSPQKKWNRDGLPEGRYRLDPLQRYTYGDPQVTYKYYDAKYNEVTKAEKPGRYGAVVNIHFKDGVDLQKFYTLYCAPKPLGGMRMFPLQVLESKMGLPQAILDNIKPPLSENIHYMLFPDNDPTANLAIMLAGLSEIATGGKSSTGWANPRIMNFEWWEGLRQKLGLVENYPYVTNLPDGYDDDANKKWPLIVVLHGAGEGGGDLYQVRRNGLARFMYLGKKLPAIVVIPSCTAREDWNPVVLSRFIDEVSQKYRVDTDRITIMGLSMGAYAAWDMGIQYPGRFAALVPIAGGANPADAAKLKNLPIWTFHGGDDDPSQESDMVDAITKAGGTSVHFTLYPGIGHWEWDYAYQNPNVYTWLFAQKRNQPEVKTPGLPPALPVAEGPTPSAPSLTSPVTAVPPVQTPAPPATSSSPSAFPKPHQSSSSR